MIITRRSGPIPITEAYIANKTVDQLHEIAEEHSISGALKITDKSRLKRLQMRHAPHKDRQKRPIKSIVTRTPSTTTAPASGLPTPLSPKRQQQRRRHLLSSPSPSSSTSHTANPNVISLLSDDSSDSDIEIVESRRAKASSARPTDAAIARWLGNPPAAQSSSGASQSRAAGGIPSPSITRSVSNTSSTKSISAPEEFGHEGGDDMDQLVWSDEDGSAVPAHIARARKSTASKEIRKQQRAQSGSSSRPKKRGRPLKATGRTPAPAQEEAPVPAASTPLTSRWRFA